jgi:hypothetical protein
VAALLPNHRWQEWRFHRAPNGFWLMAENRLRYLRWLAGELGYHRPEDWYAIRISACECVKHMEMSRET